MSAPKSQVIPWIAYPGAMVSAFLVYAVLGSQGVSVVVSSYAAVVFGAVAVTVLEFITIRTHPEASLAGHYMVVFLLQKTGKVKE